VARGYYTPEQAQALWPQYRDAGASEEPR